MALTTIDDRGLKTPIDLLDSEKIRFGTGNDLEIFHNGSQTLIDNNTGTLAINTASSEIQINKGTSEYMGRFIVDGAVELYYDNSKKLETHTNGINITGRVWALGTGGYGYAANDNIKAAYGTGNDLEIYHDSSHSWITNATGDLMLKCTGDDIVLQSQDDINMYVQGAAASPESAIFAKGNGAVELYYDGSKKLNTESGGITVVGTVWTDAVQLNDNEKYYAGTSQDLEIYHTGSDSWIKNNTGALIIRGSGGTSLIHLEPKTDENGILVKSDGEVSLYYDNSKKFETTSTGTTVTGTLTLTNYLRASGDLLLCADHDNSLSGSALRFCVDGESAAEKMRIAADGKVGINNNNPSFPLHITNTSSTFNSAALIRGDNATTGQGSYATFTNTTDSKSAYFGLDGAGFFGASAGAALVGTSGSDPILFATNGNTVRGRIDSDGFKFGTDTASSSALNDYEKGIWTPSWKGNSNHGTTAYGGTNRASYTKIGNLVHVSGYTQITGNSGGSGAWIIDNLPFATPNDLGHITTGSCMMEANQDSDGLWLVPYKNANSSQIFFYYTRDDASWFTFDLSDDTTFNIIWGITYQA